MELRPAASVILCRDAADGIETFMLRRSERSAFAPNVYVFPGGTVDAEDHGASGDAERWRRAFRMERPPPLDLQRALVAAAQRELREEAGVTVGSGDLELFSHWVTPESIEPRYDAYFFVCRMPPNQEAVADAGETHDGIWISPADALARGERGTFAIIYPTRRHLERLRAFHSVDALLEFARGKPIRTVLARGDVRRGFSLPEELDGAW